MWAVLTISLVPYLLFSATVASPCPQPLFPGPPSSTGFQGAVAAVTDFRLCSSPCTTGQPSGLLSLLSKRPAWIQSDTQKRWPPHDNMQRGPGSCWEGRAVGTLLFCPKWLGWAALVLRSGLLGLKLVCAPFSVSPRTPGVGAVHPGPGHYWGLSHGSRPSHCQCSLLPFLEHPISTTTMWGRYCYYLYFSYKKIQI